MLRFLIAITAALALLASAPTAEAGWRVDRSLEIAETVWHMPSGSLSLAYGDPIAQGAGDGAGGWAWAGDYTIRIPNGSHYEFEELCTIVLHEAGHVAGMGHSSNPRSIMYGEPLVIKTTARINGKTIIRWDGVDHRCLDRGRPYLQRSGLL